MARRSFARRRSTRDRRRGVRKSSSESLEIRNPRTERDPDLFPTLNQRLRILRSIIGLVDGAQRVRRRTMRGSDSKISLQRATLSTALALTLVSQSSLAAGDVDSARFRAADSEPQNWFTLGRDQNQTYYSPLVKIDAGNVEPARICLGL